MIIDKSPSEFALFLEELNYGWLIEMGRKWYLQDNLDSYFPSTTVEFIWRIRLPELGGVYSFTVSQYLDGSRISSVGAPHVAHIVFSILERELQKEHFL